MDNILPAYNDPLFSIFVIVILVLIVAISSYVMGNVKEEREAKILKKFLNRFEKKNSCLEIEELPFEKALIQPLSLLAQAFGTQGEYQKAINLNLYLIKNIFHFHEKESIFEQLGEIYLKAGFIERAESIFLEILHKHPRNILALKQLSVVYELLHKYDKALETLVPLKVLDIKTDKLKAHIELLKLLNNKQLSNPEKVIQLKTLLENPLYPYRAIMKALFKLDLKIAWANVQTDKIASILDILWFLPSLNLNLDIISANETLSAIYTAKGRLTLNDVTPISNIFAVDTIIAVQKSNKFNVDLNFSYGCGKCRQHFPIEFLRCPKCYALDAIQIKESLAKKESQTGYSLL